MSELQLVEPGAEVRHPVDRMEAQRLDGRIRRLATSARSQLIKVAELVEEAKARRIHEVLGFSSWTGYLADALGGRLELPGDARVEMVRLLAGEGMSVRAIAAATGVSKSTVDRDLAHVSRNGAPAPDADVPQRDTSSEDYDAVAVQLLSEAVAAVMQEKTTGLDGKSYTKPQRKPRAKKEPKPKLTPEPTKVPRLAQIPTVYREKSKELKPLIATLGHLTQDPRWPKAIARFNHNDRVTLDAYIAALQEFRAAMGDLDNTTPIRIHQGVSVTEHPTDNSDEQREFNRLTNSIGLELLELARRMHRENGIDMADAWEGLSSDNPLVVLGAFLRVLEASITLGAGRDAGAFEHRVHVLRETLKSLLERDQ